MNKKILSALVIVVLVASTIAGITIFLIGNNAPTPNDELSDYAGEAWISEIQANSSLEPQDEFIELYIPDNFTDSSITNWYITTFDEEGLVRIPEITGIDGEDYIAIYSGRGDTDVDASDGAATIYLGFDTRILNPEGDEVAIFDESGNVINFVRYGGGNGDTIYGSWDQNEDGPDFADWERGSFSLFGMNPTNTSDWMTSLPTPAAPNQYSFFVEDLGYEVVITSGISKPFTFEGIDDEVSLKGETVEVHTGPGVNASEYVKKIKEHISFSLKFYHEKGFTRGPATDKPKKINVTVVQGTSTEVVGSCSSKGNIVIKLGTKPSKIDLKYVCEHELMHAFQFKTHKVDGDTVDHLPVPDKFWIEGQATYWGIESTKKNYNLTNKEIQDEFDRVGDHNWYDHYTDLNLTIFKGWGGSYSHYMGSYLFNKFLSEKFGEDKLKDIFEKAIDNYNNNSRDKSPQEAIAEVLGMSWDRIVAMFHAWMMTDAIEDNGVPERKTHVNVTYTNETTGDSLKVAPYAAGVERIKINGNKPFSINFQKPTGTVWRITIIYVYEDGSREQAFNTPFTLAHSSSPWPVNPSNHPKKLKEIIVIKTLVQSDKPQIINMTVVPKPDPMPLYDDVAYPWELPAGMWNTSYHDAPHNVTIPYEYEEDLHNRTLQVNVTTFAVDSFFDIYVDLDGDRKVSIPNIDPQEIEDGLDILWDPDGSWPFGNYSIIIKQATWDSILNGTVTMLTDEKEGTTFENPIQFSDSETIHLDSEAWKTSQCVYFVTETTDDLRYWVTLAIDSGFEGTEWIIEIYNTTHQDYILNSTEGIYPPGTYPRTLDLPTFFDDNQSEDGVYIIKVVFQGPGTGNITLYSEPIEGTSIELPVWHTIETSEEFDLPIPYGSQGLYVNSTVAHTTYSITISATIDDLNIEIWNGAMWIACTYEGLGEYSAIIAAESDLICIHIMQGVDAGTVIQITSAIT